MSYAVKSWFSSLRAATLALVVIAMAPAGFADTSTGLERLKAALAFDEVIEILSGEGLALADDYDEETMGIPLPAWEEALSEIYDPELMHAELSAHFEEAFEHSDTDAMRADV